MKQPDPLIDVISNKEWLDGSQQCKFNEETIGKRKKAWKFGLCVFVICILSDLRRAREEFYYSTTTIFNTTLC